MRLAYASNQSGIPADILTSRSRKQAARGKVAACKALIHISDKLATSCCYRECAEFTKMTDGGLPITRMVHKRRHVYRTDS